MRERQKIAEWERECRTGWPPEALVAVGYRIADKGTWFHVRDASQWDELVVIFYYMFSLVISRVQHVDEAAAGKGRGTTTAS